MHDAYSVQVCVVFSFLSEILHSLIKDTVKIEVIKEIQ